MPVSAKTPYMPFPTKPPDVLEHSQVGELKLTSIVHILSTSSQILLLLNLGHTYMLVSSTHITI